MPARCTWPTRPRLPVDDVLLQLGSSPAGLSDADAGARLAAYGENAVRSHGTRAYRVLLGQVENPLLVLLVAAAQGESGGGTAWGDQPTS